MMTAVVAVLTIVVAVLALLVVGLLRSHAVILRALHDAGVDLDPDGSHHGPTAGRGAGHLHDAPGGDGGDGRGLRPTIELDSATAPDIRTVAGVPEPAGVSGARATDIVGTTPEHAVRSVAMLGRQDTLLAFLTTGCGTCAGFWRAFAEGVRLPPDTRLVIVTKGGESESPADVAAIAPGGATVVMSSAAWDDFGVPVAPYFALVDGRSGVVVGEGAAHSWDLVEQMLHRAVADSEKARMSRRDIFLGRGRHREVDADLERAGIVPGDPRLHHPRAAEAETEPEALEAD